MMRLFGLVPLVVGALVIFGRRRFARATAASRRELWGRFDTAVRFPWLAAWELVVVVVGAAFMAVGALILLGVTHVGR